ncbi:hypothetical protein JOD29_000495 [Lysinibacillus composti]|uniref:Uncharacterized protein n=1 Tax=Lysinibacillus composti TaxID=720633 RepID=A0A3N9UJR7_9BACI|nr:hypothetical protein [Lysinibacillus composti]MBM7607258.1 hypothetical protein [Lysinibacillus composti]RQW76165.1 hypothetical protein EBB45_01040 [Lysinibacillus composti]
MQENKDVTAFGCCAFWKVCELGTKPCVYSESNLAKQQACGAYKRATQGKTSTLTLVQKEKEVVQPSTVPIEKETSIFDSNEDGQLTLF